MNRGKDSPDLTVADFMPKFEPEPETEEEDDTSALERLAAALGATVVNR